MKQKNKKIRQLAEYLKNNPDDSFTKFALALELLKQNEVMKAQVLFESILKQDSEYLGVYYHLGKLYERINEFSNAKKMYEDGLKVAEEQQNEKTALELKEAMESVTVELDNESST